MFQIIEKLIEQGIYIRLMYRHCYIDLDFADERGTTHFVSSIDVKEVEAKLVSIWGHLLKEDFSEQLTNTIAPRVETKSVSLPPILPKGF